ncbi:SDR family NAD(P)-dependent oxidoreductase [Streptomyces sp. NPDC048361]|uniref:SDR family NAD(P)-dependent oxidoreductase n=1 Tax=Streptomyces sp. NPDC048361 TaxID=3154720 RepID=UPI003421FBE1
MNDSEPLALVTGASSGIGFELAKQFARNGFVLLLTAEDDELDIAADEIRAEGARVETVRVDLAEPGGVDRLYAAVTSMAGMEDTKLGRQDKDDPAQVAKDGFEALMSGRTKSVAGSLKTKAQEMANKVLPDSAKAAAHRKMAEPGSGGSGDDGPPERP